MQKKWDVRGRSCPVIGWVPEIGWLQAGKNSRTNWKQVYLERIDSREIELGFFPESIVCRNQAHSCLLLPVKERAIIIRKDYFLL